MITDPNTPILVGGPGDGGYPLTFNTGPQLSESVEFYSITAGHFASQSRGDIVFAATDGIHYRAYNPSSGDFNGSQIFGQNDDVRKLYTADVNNDGFDDIVGISTLFSNNNAELKVYLGNSPNGGSAPAPFSAAITASIPTGLSISSDNFFATDDLAFADFNKDGRLDIIIIGLTYNSSSTGGNNTTDAAGAYSIGFGDGNGNFSFPSLTATGNAYTGTNVGVVTADVSARVTAGDFDGDGLVDVAFAFHPADDVELLGDTPAYVRFGTSADGTQFTSNVGNGWDNPEDVQAVRPYAGAPADQLVIAFETSTHFVSFNADRTILNDNKASSTPRGPLGSVIDFNGDGQADVMWADGNSSAIGIAYDWSGTSGDIDQVGGMHLGVDIQTAFGFDIDGDGKPDFVGAQDTTGYTYFNTSPDVYESDAVSLVENQAVAGARINGVPQGLLTGNGSMSFAVTLVASVADYDNAVGYYEISANGTIGTARFLDMSAPAGASQAIGTLAAGSRLGFFLVADGDGLNGPLSGSFRFETADGAPARISDTAPLLRDATGADMAGAIFHTADIDAFDNLNRLNTGGQVQALSRKDGNAMVIAFEDTVLTGGDADFNDLVLRVTRTQPDPFVM